LKAVAGGTFWSDPTPDEPTEIPVDSGFEFFLEREVLFVDDSEVRRLPAPRSIEIGCEEGAFSSEEQPEESEKPRFRNSGSLFSIPANVASSSF
jgi:hypothetical protein